MNKIIINQIKSKIYNIRNIDVLVDRDLASIYGVETKRLLEQVRRNIERFPERYVFQMNEEEFKKWKSQFATSNSDKMGLRRPPYCFTEQGSYMVSNVLKNKKAVDISIAIVDAFVEMKNYFLSNSMVEQKYINNMVFKHDKDIKMLINSFNEVTHKEKVNKLFFKGDFFDSHLVLLEIFDEAKYEIIIIDNYASKELLKILKNIGKKITIISSNIDKILKSKYEKQYSNITFINNNTIHDRFIIIDRNKLYTCGSSFKDLGKKCFAINEIENKRELDRLLDEIKKTNYNNSSSNTSSGSES